MFTWTNRQSWQAAYAIWMRNVTLYLKTWYMSLLPNFFEPFLYLIGMGLGLGFYMKHGLNGQNYIEFIGPGLIASSAMNGAIFETTYNMYVRMHFEKTYDAYLGAPSRITDILMGEIIWAMTRSFLYCSAFILILFGFTLWGHNILIKPTALLIPFAALLVGAMFALIGALFTSLVKNIDLYTYFFTLFITPLFLFSGIFYPIDRFPYAETIAWFTPLHHCVVVMRGLAQDPWTQTHTGSLFWLLIITIILFAITPRLLSRKLSD